MGPRVRRALEFEVLEGRLLKSATLAFTTSGDVVGQGPLGDQSWTASEIIEFGRADFGLEPGTTSGSFSPLFDLNDFGVGGAGIDALHLVTEEITVAGVRLAEGSLLFSTDSVATFADFTAAPNDVVLFTPDGADPYRSGTFSLLIDGSDIGINADIQAVSLAMADVDVGDRSLSAGTFLLAGVGIEPVDSPSVAVTSRDIIVLEAATLGGSSTSGTTSFLLDGGDIGLDREIAGIHVASRTGLIANRTITAGSLLVTLNGDAPSVGINGIAVAAQDIFELTVTRAGTDTAATASLWFEGSDVSLTTDADLAGIALTAVPTANSPPTTTGIADLTVPQDAPDTVIDLFAAFDDLEDADSELTYTIVGNTDPSLFSQVVVDEEAGTLTLDYAPSAFGASAVTVRATDTAGASVETVFEVTVNSPPTTTGIADLVMTSQTSSAVIDLFAAFDDREDADPELTYTIVGNTDPSLFSDLQIDEEAGLLRLQYAAGAQGTTEITLRATDSQGDSVETSFAVTVDVPTEPPAPPDPGWFVDSQDSTPSSVNVRPSLPGDRPVVDTVAAGTRVGEPLIVPQSGSVPSAFGSPTGFGSAGSAQGAPSDQTPQEVDVSSNDERATPVKADGSAADEASPRSDLRSVADRASEPKAVATQANEAHGAPPKGPVDSQPELAASAAPAAGDPSTRASDAVLATWKEGEDLNGLTALWHALDDLATETAQAGQPATSERLLVAGIGGVLSVGYVMWAVPRGCLLLLTGTSAPLWKNWDLVSVLHADSRKRGARSKAPPEDESLESILG